MTIYGKIGRIIAVIKLNVFSSFAVKCILKEIYITFVLTTGCLISVCMKTNAYQAIKNELLSHKIWICTFMRCGHLTYDTWLWLKITSLSSTASVLNDGRISLEILSFCSVIFFFKTSKQGDSSRQLIDFEYLSGFENLSGLNDLNRDDNITGLNDLNSLFGLNSLISSKHLLSMMYPSTWQQNGLSWSFNVEWIIKNPQFYGFLALFLLEAVEAMDVTFNQIQGS